MSTMCQHVVSFVIKTFPKGVLSNDTPYPGYLNSTEIV